jgi:hypothetical protein
VRDIAHPTIGFHQSEHHAFFLRNSNIAAISLGFPLVIRAPPQGFLHHHHRNRPQPGGIAVCRLRRPSPRRSCLHRKQIRTQTTSPTSTLLQEIPPEHLQHQQWRDRAFTTIRPVMGLAPGRRSCYISLERPSPVYTSQYLENSFRREAGKDLHCPPGNFSFSRNSDSHRRLQSHPQSVRVAIATSIYGAGIISPFCLMRHSPEILCEMPSGSSIHMGTCMA